MLVKVIAVVVESLAAVTVIGALVVPTVTVPKLSFFGLRSSPCAFFASAVPPTSVRRNVRLSARIASALNLDRIMFGSSSRDPKNGQKMPSHLSSLPPKNKNRSLI